MKYFIQAIKSYAVFKGRARRKEYWMFILFNVLFAFAAVLVDNVLGTAYEPVGYGVVYFLYCLFVFVPGLSVTVRRLHDVGKSGWFYFIVLIPIVGAIWILILLCSDSKPGENQYGPNPKELAYS